jgi:hypothetical protein
MHRFTPSFFELALRTSRSLHPAAMGGFLWDLIGKLGLPRQICTLAANVIGVSENQ